MTQEFIPYEQALALKELGFDEPCFGWYQSSRLKKEYHTLKNSGNQSYMRKEDCNAPTFSAVFRWFRNEHSLDSWVYPDVSKDKGYYSIIVSRRRFVVNNELKGSYEEAELETLKKLIEVVKGEVKLKDVII